MAYTDDFSALGKVFSLEDDRNEFPGSGIQFRNFSFQSDFTRHLPGDAGLSVIEKDYLTALSDRDITENKDFRYPVFIPEGYQKSDKVIILLHGLNEKSWDKYLPWAHELVQRTGYSVVLFPISFHMNRTPSKWYDPRGMVGLSRFRENRYADQACSTFANAALSERLDNKPERFALSGYQSIMDLLNLVNYISSGKHPVFKKRTEIHFFGYSIGAFLAQVLMIANPGGIFDHSRFVLFAGGSVFSDINGISRFIIDKQAFGQLRKYYLNHSSWRRRTLKSYVEVLDVKNIARAFMAMLSPEYFRPLREKTFARFHDRLLVFALEQDKVFPAEQIMENFERSGVWVNLLDFPYEYSHETPFPVSENAETSQLVDQWFERIFSEAGDFLREYSVYGFSGS